jgi:general secretion pathway protein D
VNDCMKRWAQPDARRAFRRTGTAGPALGLALCCALVLALVGSEVAAQQRNIPVKTGKAGTLNKSGKRKLNAGAGTSGVVKRSKGGSLDPKYDPAVATEALQDGPETPGRAVAEGRAAAPSETAGAAGESASSGEDHKKIEDSITWKTNFEKDIKCRPLPRGARVTLDFEEAPIESVIKLMSCWTTRNFMLSTSRRGAKVTILSPRPVSVLEAWRAFLSALEVNGMTVTRKGPFWHIVDSNQARARGARILGAKDGTPDDDAIVTRLVRLEHVDIQEVEALLSKFKTQGGDIFSYKPTNTLIITDTGSSIRRMLELIKEVDIPLGNEKIWIRPVQHMTASELVERINAVFGEGSGGASSSRGAARRPASKGRAAAAASGGGADITKVIISKVIADERTNQIIMITTRSNYLKVDRLIRKLDVPIPGEGAIHIHPLENADAEDLASTLQSLAGGGGSSGGARGGAKGGRGGAKSGGSAALFEGEVKITAHKATNSLVIEASLKDYLSLQRVIAQLDRRRKQVYVEAVVMEISTSKRNNTQIAGSAGTAFDIGGDEVPLLVGLGGLGMGGVDISQLNSGGLAAGMQGPLLQLNTGNTGGAVAGALSIPAFGFLIQAIQENSDVNVLSTPHILTLNNEDAEIQVGRKIPYRQSSLGGGLGGLSGLAGLAGGASGALGGLGGALGGLGGLGGSMVQFIDVDLTLKITPQINESDFIKLKIDQQIDEVEAMDPNLGPTTSKRKITNTVVVRDQQPIVIGGLITDRESTGVAKIPLLGDLPLIGMLFRKTTKTKEKKNLLLIVVPHIIKDPSDIRRIHDEKMNQLRAFADELATRRKEHDGNIDFRKKRGLLQHIHESVEASRSERKLMEKAYYDSTDVDMVGPPESHDLEHDPFGKQLDEEEERGEKSDSIDLPGSEPTKPLGGSKGKSGGKGADSKGADSKGADSKGADSKGADSKGADSKGADSKGADSKGANSKPAPQAAKDTNPPAKERADDKAAKSGNNSEDDEK